LAKIALEGMFAQVANCDVTGRVNATALTDQLQHFLRPFLRQRLTFAAENDVLERLVLFESVFSECD
jgi:hypothetical protein